MSDPSTEDEIRWAAYGVLVEDGYDAFTTKAVADAAGVSQSLVHYYFETKEDLVFAMFENGLDHLTSAVEDRLDADDPRERLLELARYMIRGEELDDAVEFNRMLLEIHAQAPYDERLRDAVQYENEFLRSYVVDAVDEGIEAGQFRPVDAETFAATFLAAIATANNWNAIFGTDADDDLVLAGLETIVDDYLTTPEGESA